MVVVSVFSSCVLTLVVPPAVPAPQLAIRVPTASAAVPAIDSDLGIFPQPTVLLANDKVLTEEEQIARDGARRIAAIVFVLGAGPSFFAQYELVWKKERQQKQELKQQEREQQERMSRRQTARGALPSEVQAVVNGFKRSYSQKEVTALWTALKSAYGGEAKAVRAAVQNPTVLNPSYTRPATVSSSKKALVTVLGGEEEALEVMLKNPAVLQCGATLVEQPASQIRSFASFRATIDALPGAAPVAGLGTLALLLVFEIAGKRGALPAEADSLVQGTGVLLAAVGVGATLVGLVLQNVAETGRPRK